MLTILQTTIFSQFDWSDCVILSSVNFLPLTHRSYAMTDNTHTTNWPDLAIGLYDRLTGRNAQINYEFEELKVSIPSGTGNNAEHADWKLSGRLSITTNDGASSP